MTRTNPDLIFKSIHEKIITLEFLPGQQITESEIASMFNVSRTPIREVYRKLESAGLIEIKSQVGTFVTLIDVKEISDLLYMREKLETSVLHDIGHISESQLLSIRINLIQQEKLIQEYEGKELARKFFELDNAMHASFFQLANKANLWNRISVDQPHYNRVRMLTTIAHEKKAIQELYEQHKEILFAIENENFEAVDALYKVHIYSGFKDLPQLVMKNREYFKM